MVKLTDTTAKNVFERKDASSPHNYALFELQTDPSRPGLTRITLPYKSIWTPGPHWHEKYTEFFRVLKGKVIVKLNGVAKTVGPDDGPQRVDKFVIHEFMRADIDKPDDEKDAGDVVTEEWTDPSDGAKHVFFRNIFSRLEEPDQGWMPWIFLQVLFMVVHNDNFIVFVPGRLTFIFTHAVYSVINVVGRICGFRKWHKEYTPKNLRQVAPGSSAYKQD